MTAGTVQEHDQHQLEIARWNEPVGLKPRGTLFLFTGLGETPEVYARFAARLSADAYRVVVLSAPDYASTDTQAVVEELIGAPEVVEPRVLVGSDVGARAALEFVGATKVTVDGLITAGLALADRHLSGDQGAELAARTACPVHRGVLARATHATLATPAAAIVLAHPAPIRIDVPVLAIHGAADVISPLAAAIDVYRDSGVADVTVVDDGRHDILNDVSHRAVAAVIVLFLERLRLGADHPPLVRTPPTHAEPVTT